MRILCTGGAGYVGSACLRWLLKHGHDVVAYDNLVEGNSAAVPDDRLIKGDILDGELLTSTMRSQRTDVVMHFAALASVPDSIDRPDIYWRINCDGTQQVLESMRQASVNRIVYSSTAAAYSFDQAMPLHEDAAKLPEVAYGRSKLAGEWLIQDYARADGLSYTILRYFNASGADLDGNHGESRRQESHIIPLILDVAVGKRSKFFVYGSDWATADGTCIRDFVHIEDIAEAHRLSAEALMDVSAAGFVFNIGTGNGASVLEVVHACEQAVGRPIPCELVERRPGDPAILVANASRIQRRLDWRPRHNDLTPIVESAWKWHQSHPSGYDGSPFGV